MFLTNAIHDLVNYTTDTISYGAYMTLYKLNLVNVAGVGNKVYHDEGARVCEGIYIGSLATAMNKDALIKNNIGAIVNLSGSKYLINNIPVTNIIMDDTNITSNNLDYYIKAFNFGCDEIARYRAMNKNVLIHCAAGINRSATQIAMYLISKGSSYEDAYSQLRAANDKRGVMLLTNHSFRYLLKMNDSIKNTKCQSLSIRD